MLIILQAPGQNAEQPSAETTSQMQITRVDNSPAAVPEAVAKKDETLVIP
jgi:hypothetical protein